MIKLLKGQPSLPVGSRKKAEVVFLEAPSQEGKDELPGTLAYMSVGQQAERRVGLGESALGT